MSRFVCPSASLVLKSLLKRRTLVIGLISSTALHASLTSLRVLAVEEQIAKPLTTQFIKRQPRLTKPLELRKRPRPKRRQIRRETVTVRARADRRDISSAVLPVQLAERLARPHVDIRRITGLEESSLEPATVAQAVVGTMAVREAVDMSLEMLDLDALDTGKYHAMVIQDPNDKRNIRGFFHLCVVEIPTMATARWFTSRYTEPGIVNLIRAVNERTDIRADVQHRGDFSSQELFKTPWIYGGTAKPFQLTASEEVNLGKYLLSGGFFFSEEWINVPDSYEGAKRAFVNMFSGALGTQGYGLGRDWAFEQVAAGHALFHCFYDFENVPAGYVWGTMSEYPEYLESGLWGATVGGRLVGTFEHKTLIEAWSGRPGQERPQRRALEFGINTIVFALTQEGSITHRVMEEVR